MNIILTSSFFIIAVAAAVVIFSIMRGRDAPVEPIALFEAQGGGTCADPDWRKWAIELSLQFIADGGLSSSEINAIGHFFDRSYSGEISRAEFEAINRGSSADENCRDHYSRFGGNYPAHVTPC